MASAESPEQLAERLAQDLLGISAGEAFAMLDSGELEGTMAGALLQSARWLMGAEEDA